MVDLLTNYFFTHVFIDMYIDMINLRIINTNSILENTLTKSNNYNLFINLSINIAINIMFTIYILF